MHNGIKKLFITSLFVIFSLCFNSSFAYTQIDNCYYQPWYATYKWTCRDYEINELISTEYDTWGTIYYDGNFYYNGTLNILWYKQYFENSSHSWYTSTYLIYNEFSWTTMFNGIEYNDLWKTSIYLQTWTEAKYCTFNTWDSNAWAVCATPRANKAQYNKTVQQVQEWINWASLTWFRVYYWASSSIQVPNVQTIIAICLSFDNWFNYCMPFETHTENNMWNTMTRAWYTTQTKIVNEQSGIIPLNYILENYTKYPNPFEFEHQEIPTTWKTETTTILWQCPTIREILSTYWSEYNTWICYSATRLLTQTWIVNTTAQSIFELYPTFTDRSQDYNYYKQYCDNVPTSVCREAFSWNEIKWSLLNKTPQDNPIAIYQYCHLQLNIQDKNATTCVLSTWNYYATWVDEAIIEEIQGNQSVLDIMLNSFNNLKDELPSFSSGTVFDEFLEEGETWKDGFKLDIFKTFIELWSKITSIFIFRHQYDGIIPTYITSIIVIILLFKILKK